MTATNPIGCTDAEWRARVDLAAAYRLTHHFGMTTLTYNHITARVPGTDGEFLINEFGLGYDEVTASNLVKLQPRRQGASTRARATSTSPGTSSTPPSTAPATTSTA